MKEKLITVILNFLILALPIVIIPSASLYNMPKIIVLLITGIILFILLMLNYKKLTIDKTDILLLIFAGLVFLSTMFSSNLKTSIFGAFGRYEGMLAYYAYIIIYFCTKKFYRSNENTTLKVLYVLFISISTLGILQHFISIPELYPIFNKGVCGSFGNTNFMGSFVSIGIPVFTILYITKGYKLSFLTAQMVFFCMLTCHARSSWVAFAGLAIIILVFLLKQKNKRFWKRAIYLTITFIVIFLCLYLESESIVKQRMNIIKKDIKMAITNENKEDIGSYRIKIWKATISVIKRKPILGVGTDNLQKGLTNLNTEETINIINLYGRIPFDKAHNEYLHILATIGIPALIIYLIFIYKVLLRNAKVIFKNFKTFIITASILCYMIQAFFNISTIGIAPLFWFALGLLDKEKE